MATVFQWRNETADVLNDEVQKGLAHWNHERLAPRLPDETHDGLRAAAMLLFEGEFFEH